jgi:hypothetical protein
MNTRNWMMDAAISSPRGAKSARHKRRSTDRRGLNVVDLMLALAVMVVTTWGISELNSLLFR